MVTKADFLDVCRRCVPEDGRQGSDYFKTQSLRLWNTFAVCEKLLEPGDSMISVGAGSAYIEHALHHLKQVSVTVVDFPEAIDAHAREYARSNFDTIGCDLTVPLEIPARFNLALSCEIIEHLPKDPQIHISQLAGLIDHQSKPGLLVLSTPNIANLRNIVKLALMRPIMPPPRLVFSEVSYENEGIHRREYLPVEIVSCLRQAGLPDVTVHYTDYKEPSSPKGWFFLGASKVSGRFAQAMIVVARQQIGQGRNEALTSAARSA